MIYQILIFPCINTTRFSLSLHYYYSQKYTTMRMESILNLLFFFFISMLISGALGKGRPRGPSAGNIADAIATNASAADAVQQNQTCNAAGVTANQAAANAAALANPTPTAADLNSCIAFAQQAANAANEAVAACNQAANDAQPAPEVVEPVVELPGAPSGKGLQGNPPPVVA